jgi:regulatory protein
MPIPPERARSEEAAKEAALRILGRGPRTEREIRDRLTERGYATGAIDGALERLRRVSLLDDRAFLRSYLRVEVPRRLEGRRLLVQRLKRRGLSGALLEELDQFLDDDPDLAERDLNTEEGRAKAALAHLSRRMRGREERDRARRLASQLVRKGFDWSMVREVISDPGETDPSHTDATDQ